MIWKNLMGRILFAKNIDTKAVQWSRYRGDLVENSDFRKFDGILRMVMDGSDQQTQQLRDWLEAECGNQALVFGMHKSDEALLTCIVQSYNGNQHHFVDGSDGGYAMAARELKQQLAQFLLKKAAKN